MLPTHLRCSFLKDFLALDTRRAEALLQTILSAAHVYRDGRIELEFGRSPSGHSRSGDSPPSPPRDCYYPRRGVTRGPRRVRTAPSRKRDCATTFL